MTTFIQIIDYHTERGDEMEKLLDEWRDTTEGQRTAVTAVTTRDREDGTHYVTIVEFPSYEEAMRNNDLPETQKFSGQMAALCIGAPKFLNLDEIRRDKA